MSRTSIVGGLLVALFLAGCGQSSEPSQDTDAGDADQAMGGGDIDLGSFDV